MLGGIVREIKWVHFPTFCLSHQYHQVFLTYPPLCVNQLPITYRLVASRVRCENLHFFNLSVNKLQSSPTKPAATNLLISRQQGSLQKPAGFNLSVNKPQSSRHSSVRDTSPTHGHNKPMSAVITPHVVNTAYISIHPLSVYTPHDESQSETQRVEAPSQPFRFRPTLGCLTGSGGKGSDVARRQDDHNTSRPCAPALREFLRVTARVSDGQMDEQADQQRVHPAVRLPPTVQWDTGNTPVIPRTVSCAPSRAAGTPVERGYFQGSSRGRKSGVLLPLFSCPEKDRGDEIHP